jgi:hypothetical protein
MFGIKYDIQHMYEYGCFVPLYTGTIEEIKRDSRGHFETDQKKMCETEYDYGYYFEYDENAWNEFKILFSDTRTTFIFGRIGYKIKT